MLEVQMRAVAFIADAAIGMSSAHPLFACVMHVSLSPNFTLQSQQHVHTGDCVERWRCEGYQHL